MILEAATAPPVFAGPVADAATRIAWPTTAPKWVVAYPGATVSSAFGGAAQGERGGTITFATPDAAAAVIAFYTTTARRVGLTKVTTGATGTTRLFSARAAEGGTLAVQATPVAGSSMVVVTYRLGR